MVYFLKVLVSAILIVAISEIGKRSSFWAAILASLPLTSLIAFVFLYLETNDVNKVAELSKDIFWLVIPSLLFFVSFPIMLNKGISFFPSLVLSMILMIVAYFIMSFLLKKMGLA